MAENRKNVLFSNGEEIPMVGFGCYFGLPVSNLSNTNANVTLLKAYIKS